MSLLKSPAELNDDEDNPNLDKVDDQTEDGEDYKIDSEVPKQKTQTLVKMKHPIVRTLVPFKFKILKH